MLDFFHTTGRPVHILLSKADKLSKNEQIKTLSQVKKLLKPYSERQNISVQLFSSLKKQGLEEVNQTVGSWFAATDVPLSLSVEDWTHYTENVFTPLDQPQTFKKLPSLNIKCRLKTFSDGIVYNL